TTTQSEAAADASNPEAGAHDHDPDGGPAPEGIQEATDPRYAVGETVILNTDHMPGMDGAEATISGAFDTTTYSVSYTPPMAVTRSPTINGWFTKNSKTLANLRLPPVARPCSRPITWPSWTGPRPPLIAPPTKPRTWSVLRWMVWT